MLVLYDVFIKNYCLGKSLPIILISKIENRSTKTLQCNWNLYNPDDSPVSQCHNVFIMYCGGSMWPRLISSTYSKLPRQFFSSRHHVAVYYFVNSSITFRYLLKSRWTRNLVDWSKNLYSPFNSCDKLRERYIFHPVRWSKFVANCCIIFENGCSLATYRFRSR